MGVEAHSVKAVSSNRVPSARDRKQLRSFFFSILALLCATGCSSSPKSALKPPSGAVASSSTVVVETPQDQALHAIAAAPREFQLNFGEAQYAWERTQIFFSSHTDGAFLKMASEGGTSGSENYASITNAPGGRVRSGAKDNFIYDVRKIPVRGGFRFQVNCVPASATGDKNAAKRNALNLARFIKNGELEASLLVR